MVELFPMNDMIHLGVRIRGVHIGGHESRRGEIRRLMVVGRRRKGLQGRGEMKEAEVDISAMVWVCCA